MYNESFGQALKYYWRKIQNTARQSIDLHRRFQDASKSAGAPEFEDARLFYKEMLRKNPKSPKYLYLYGRCLPCIDAMPYYKKAYELKKDFYWTHMGIGACYFDLHKYKKAEQAFEKAVKANPKAVSPYKNLSLTYLHQGNIRKSRTVFRHLIKKDRNNAKAYESLGDYFLTQHNFNHALSAYRKAAHLGADNISFCFHLGFTSFKQGNPVEAIHYYKRSIELGNQKADVFYNLASAHELLARYDLALENFQKAYHKSKSLTTLYAIGNCAVQAGLYSKAIVSYRAFLRESINHVEAMFGLANAYHIKKDFKKAEQLYQKILKLDSNYVKAYYNLGSIYAYHKVDPAKMNHYWSILVERFPDYPDRKYIKEELNKMNKHMDRRHHAQ